MDYIFKHISIFGFVLGLVIFLIILLSPVPSSFVEHASTKIGNENNADIIKVARGMQIALALLSIMVIWWFTEAIPIPATALLPAIVLPIIHTQGWYDGKLFEFTFSNALSNYSHPVIGLFLGCFLLAAAIRKWNADKRITLWLLTRGKIAESPKSALLVLMYITAFVSMWISNTATVAIMLPIAIGILSQIKVDSSNNNFGTALMLGIAWSASIGGVGTLIGSPPNGIAISILNQNNLPTLNFLDWMKIGLPYVIVFVPVIWFLLRKIFPYEESVRIDKTFLINQKINLGKITSGEYIVGGVFFLAIILWVSNPFWQNILPENLFINLSWFDEYTIGLFIGVILFIIPTNLKKFETALNWKDTKFVDWGTLILFGGGLALSDVMFKTGLAHWLALSFVDLLGTPPFFILLFVLITMMSFMTEITSNTAITSMMVPIVIAISAGIGADPTTFAISAAIAASMAFMLPVATPPNAIVYGSGHVKLSNMIKAGFWLDIIGCFFTFSIIYLFGNLIFKILNL